MPQKCPGQMPPRGLDTVTVACPACRRKIEFFTDEATRRCRCGAVVPRQAPRPPGTGAPGAAPR